MTYMYTLRGKLVKKITDQTKSYQAAGGLLRLFFSVQKENLCMLLSPRQLRAFTQAFALQYLTELQRTHTQSLLGAVQMLYCENREDRQDV